MSLRTYPVFLEPPKLVDFLADFLLSNGFRLFKKGNSKNQYLRLKSPNAELVFRIQNFEGSCKVSLVSLKFKGISKDKQDNLVNSLWQQIDRFASRIPKTQVTLPIAERMIQEKEEEPPVSISQTTPPPPLIEQKKDDARQVAISETKIKKDLLPEATVLSEPKTTTEIIQFLPRTKTSFGTEFSPKKWLEILDQSDQVIDLQSLGLNKETHSQPGYLNLLTAIYDSKRESYDIEKRLINDSWTKYMFSFLRRLRYEGSVEYNANGSDYATVKSILEKFLTPLGTSQTPDASQRVVSRRFYFFDTEGNRVSLIRETDLSESGTATRVAFRLT